MTMPLGVEDYQHTNVNLALIDGTLVLSPVNTDSATLLQQVLDAAPDALSWHSQGKRYDDPSSYIRRLIGVYVACGGESHQRTEGNVTTSDRRGSIKLYLDLSACDDIEALRILSRFLWSTGVSVEPGSTRFALRLYATVACKVCHGRLTHETKALDYWTCNDCADNCQHEYVEGAGVANGNLAHMRYCKKCGRADPTWQPAEDPMEDLLNVVAKGDVNMLLLDHRDGTSTTITKK
jgi:hypothetical protein